LEDARLTDTGTRKKLRRAIHEGLNVIEHGTVPTISSSLPGGSI
jgi:hypothetical protein